MGIHIRGPGQFVTDDGFQITNIPFGNHICTNYKDINKINSNGQFVRLKMLRFLLLHISAKKMLKKNKRAFLKVVKLPRFLISPHVPSSEFLLSISSCSWRFPGRACNCSLPAADHTFQTKMNGALSSSYLFPHLVGVASRVPVISLLRYNPFPLSDSTSLSRGSLDPIICATCLWDVLGSCCLDILFHCS